MCGNLEKISAERIQVELVKLVTSDHPEEMQNVYDTGIAAMILPEFCTMMETEQHNPHHIYTVGEHTIRSMQYIRADKVLRLTMLLHDGRNRSAAPRMRTGSIIFTDTHRWEQR